MINKILRLFDRYFIFWSTTKKLITKFKPYIIYYMMIMLALILLIGFIYVKFLRIRLLRNIPFNLTFLGFVLLLSICAIYLYLITKVINPEQSSQIIQYIAEPIIKVLKYILTSLDIFDSAIKNNKFVNSYYKKLVEYLLPTLLEFGDIERVILYYTFKIIPGFILLMILIVDVFWLKCINIFYYFIFLGVLPLSYNYFKYSLGKLQEQYLEDLELKYDLITIQDEFSINEDWDKRNTEAIYHNKDVSIREYFDIKVKHLMKEYMEHNNVNSATMREINYIGSCFSRSEFIRQYEKANNKLIAQFTIEDFNILEQDFIKIEPRLLSLIEYINLDKRTEKMVYIGPIKVIMYSLSFVTWFYILIKSIHTLLEYNMILYYLIIHKAEILRAVLYPIILLALAFIRHIVKKC